MTISFNNIPSTLRVPSIFVEYDNSKAKQGPNIQPYKILAMGQKTSSGTRSQLLFDTITSAAQARQYYGPGSHLAQICAAILANNKFAQLTAVAIDDNGSGVPATGTITMGGTPTAVGEVVVYIAGKRIAVPCSLTSTATTLAAALNTAINADTDLPVTSAVDEEEVTLTAKNDGTLGNQIDVRLNYNMGELLPAGVTAVIVAMASGATDVTVSSIISALPETQYNAIVHPWLDSTNLTAIKAEMTDRNTPSRQLDGIAFTAKIDTLGNLATLGNAHNNAFLSIMGAQGPTAPWVWAAAYAATVAGAAQIDPGRPFQTLPLVGVLAPSETDKFTLTERNTLLYDGIATHKIAEGGTVVIERAITTYKTNANAAADTSYLDVTTVYTLSYLRYDFRNTMAQRYPRHKLANDGTRFGAGQAIITPMIGKAEMIAKFRQWELLGLVEGFDQFKNDLIVERNSQDPNRLDFLLPPDLVNSLMVVGAQIQFLL